MPPGCCVVSRYPEARCSPLSTPYSHVLVPKGAPNECQEAMNYLPVAVAPEFPIPFIDTSSPLLSSVWPSESKDSFSKQIHKAGTQGKCVSRGRGPHAPEA